MHDLDFDVGVAQGVVGAKPAAEIVQSACQEPEADLMPQRRREYRRADPAPVVCCVRRGAAFEEMRTAGEPRAAIRRTHPDQRWPVRCDQSWTLRQHPADEVLFSRQHAVEPEVACRGLAVQFTATDMSLFHPN